MGHNMSNFTGASDNKAEITCPVCGKKFKPAEEHIYHIGKHHNKLVCTYTCMRKWQKGEAEKKSKPEKRRIRKFSPVRIVETGETFNSVRECAEHLKASQPGVFKAIHTGTRIYGFHVIIVEEGEKNDR